MSAHGRRDQARIDLLERLYDAYNKGDFLTVVDQLDANVRWLDELTGVEMTSRRQVESYWKDQVGLIRTEVLPVSITVRDDGRIALTGEQTVRNPEGQVWSTQTVTHLYSFTDENLISRMQIG